MQSNKNLALRILLGAVVSLSIGSAYASAPMAKTSAPGFFRIMLGDFEVTALIDGTLDLQPEQVLIAAPGQVNTALEKAYLKAPLETSVNAYLINTGAKLVLIDTGAGTLFGPNLGKLLQNLRASGYQPEQVDEIYITHMHPDHIGGLSKNGQAVFSNATVRADQHDADFWLSKANLESAPQESKYAFQAAISSLAPYIESKHFRPFENNTVLQPGIQASASYGHTAGHTNFVIESKGQKLVLIGDLIHVGAVQFDAPDVTVVFDADAKAAAAQRQKSFDQAIKEGVLLGASHLQFPGLGHVLQKGKAYQWLPINFTQMHELAK